MIDRPTDFRKSQDTAVACQQTSTTRGSRFSGCTSGNPDMYSTSDALLKPFMEQTGTIRCAKCLKPISTYGCDSTFRGKRCGSTRVYIDLYWRKKRYQFRTDADGQGLSFDKAEWILGNIRADIRKANTDPKHHGFRPEDYTYKDVVANRFGTLMETWLEKQEELHRKGKRTWATINNYRSMAKHFSYFSGLDVRRITKADLNNFFNDYLYKKGVRKESSLKTIRNGLHSVLSWLKYDKEVIDKIPVFPTVEGDQSPPRVAMEWGQLMEAVQRLPEQYRDIILFYIHTGLRPSEVCALQVGDMNPDNSITIRRTFSAGKLHERTKQKKIRTIYLSDGALELAKKNASDKMPLHILFTQGNGSHFVPHVLSTIWTNNSGTGVVLY